MNSTKTFTTERLTLKPLDNSDANFILELVNTDGWLTFIGNKNINSIEDATAYIQKINDNENINYWSVKLKDTSLPVGLITLIKRDYLEYQDIGFAFLPAFYNKGYAFEAANTILSHLKSKNIKTINAVTLPANNISIKLIQKLGLRFEKEIENENIILQVYSASLIT